MNNSDQLKLIADLTNVHAGQYLALVDGGSLKIVQVQESNVADSYNLEPVDIEIMRRTAIRKINCEAKTRRKIAHNRLKKSQLSKVN